MIKKGKTDLTLLEVLVYCFIPFGETLQSSIHAPPIEAIMQCAA